jgi:protein-tyrosine phosphatase
MAKKSKTMTKKSKTIKPYVSYCSHYGATKVLDLRTPDGMTEIYAGSHDDIHEFDLLICLNGKMVYNPVSCTKDLNDEMSRYKHLSAADPPHITIDWRDFGTPSMTEDVWKDMFALLSSKPRKVGVYCEGGHGRTGTFLSIIAHLKGTSSQSD